MRDVLIFVASFDVFALLLLVGLLSGLRYDKDYGHQDYERQFRDRLTDKSSIYYLHRDGDALPSDLSN